ncbi:MAG: VOC family protein [Candidatus Limnocylindria bacterium]
MIANRSAPSSTVIPVLAYDDVARASDWLCRAFSFTERLRIADHRAQLVFGDGAVILTARDSEGRGAVLVRVADADRHHERARESGARILHPPTDYPYGERQYVAEDLGGYVWTFSQSIADVDRALWGGTLR